MSSDDDGVSVDPNVSLVAVDASVDGISPSDDGASVDASSDEDDGSVDGASSDEDDISVEGASDSVDDGSVEGASDSGFELLNIEPMGSKPNIPEDDEEDEDDDESSVILDTLSGLAFFVWVLLFFPLFFLEGFLLHAERQ